MKSIIAALAVVASLAVPSHAQYFSTIADNPTKPYTSLTTEFALNDMHFVGASADAALVYHKGDKDHSLLPRRWLDAGVKPVTWTLLEAGVGGDTHAGFVSFGPAVDLGPTLLGPLVQPLKDKGGNYLVVGNLLESDDGSGLKVGIHWRSRVIDGTAIASLNTMIRSTKAQLAVGYQYQFK